MLNFAHFRTSLWLERERGERREEGREGTLIVPKDAHITCLCQEAHCSKNSCCLTITHLSFLILSVQSYQERHEADIFVAGMAQYCHLSLPHSWPDQTWFPCLHCYLWKAFSSHMQSRELLLFSWNDHRKSKPEPYHCTTLFKWEVKLPPLR